MTRLSACHGPHTPNTGWGDDSPSARHTSTRSDLGAAVGHAVDRAGMVVRYQQRTILQNLDVHRPAAVFVVLEETGEKRLLRLHAAVFVQLHDDDVAADLLGPVPRTVTRNENRILVLARKHFARVEPHAERGRVRAEQRNRLLEFVARASPTHLAIREVALMAVREAEMLADLGDPVELVFGQVFRQPVASIVGEIKFLRYRVPVKAHRVAHPAGGHLGAAAVKVDAPDLPLVAGGSQILHGEPTFT